MNKFRQHIPTFIDVDDPQVYEFETTEQLLNLEVVKRYGKRPDFSHFAISDNYLMEISDDGFHWWVVGWIENPKDVDLPEWVGVKYRAELPDGKRVVLTHGQVVSSCGDDLTLRDGTKAKDLGNDQSNKSPDNSGA